LQGTAGKLKSLHIQQAIKLREWIKIRQDTTVLQREFLSGWSRPSIALKLLGQGVDANLVIGSPYRNFSEKEKFPKFYYN
jgi:hypothetical protein